MDFQPRYYPPPGSYRGAVPEPALGPNPAYINCRHCGRLGHTATHCPVALKEENEELKQILREHGITYPLPDKKRIDKLKKKVIDLEKQVAELKGVDGINS